MKIVPYEKKYKERLEQICIDTASPQLIQNKEYCDFIVLMYCDPYIDNEIAFVLLDDQDIPQGYILCAEDMNHFASILSPYIEEIKQRCPNYAYHANLLEYMPYCKEYPAHMHIDIEEPFTGNHNGTIMAEKVFAYLKEKKVTGIQLGVSLLNQRACSFYKKLGFEILDEANNSAVMGKKL